jgi:hypothetical protein
MDSAQVEAMLVARAGQEYVTDALNRPVVVDGLARFDTARLCTLRVDKLVQFLGQEAGSHNLLRVLERGVEAVGLLLGLLACAQGNSSLMNGNSSLINDQGSFVSRIDSDAPYTCSTCTENKRGRQQQCASCARLQELASRLLPPQEQVQVQDTVAQVCADKAFVNDCSRVLMLLMKAHTSSSSLQALCCCAIFNLACLEREEVSM